MSCGCGHSLVVVMFDFYFLPNYLLLFDFPAGKVEMLNALAASMGHWGTCHPRFPFNFFGQFRAAQTESLSLDSVRTWLLAGKNQKYTGL